MVKKECYLMKQNTIYIYIISSSFNEKLKIYVKTNEVKKESYLKRQDNTKYNIYVYCIVLSH